MMTELGSEAARSQEGRNSGLQSQGLSSEGDSLYILLYFILCPTENDVSDNIIGERLKRW